jgi:iron complex outermembrane recepter protein
MPNHLVLALGGVLAFSSVAAQTATANTASLEPRAASAPLASHVVPRAVVVSGTVTGTVQDSAGTPLGNVDIIVSGLGRTARTGDDGRFAIRGLPSGTHHLEVLRIGYVSAHEVVTVTEDGPDIDVTIVMHVATVRLSSVNVTATPTGTDALNVTQASSQLAGRELQRALSTSIGQTLAKEPGMSARYNGPIASTPVIRGLSGERVLVLQDGDRAGDLSSAAADHLNAVDPSTAERIEVIRGPASLLYGNNALGGVVNVISTDIPTSIPEHTNGYVLGQGESAAAGGVGSVGITVPISSTLALTARGGARTFDALRVGGGASQPNTNGSTEQFSLGGGFVGEHASAGLVFREMDFAYGLPHPAGDEAIRLEGVRRSLTLQSQLHTELEAINTVRIDGSSQWYSHNEIEEDGAIGTRFKLNTQTLNVLARTRTGRATGALGIQGLFRQYQPTGDEAFTPGADNNNIAAFVFQEFPLGAGPVEDHAPRLQLGARYDRFTLSTSPGDATAQFGAPQSRSFGNLAASLGISVPVREDVSLTANASRGFRAPAVEELFANGFHAAVGTFDVGNPDLEPEASTGFEAGVRAQSARTFAQFNTYYNIINRYIVPTAVGTQDVDGTDVPLVNFVQRDAVLYGAEGQVETRLVHNIVGGLMGDLTRAEIRGSSDYLPYIPAGRLGASLRYDNGRISAGGDVRRVFSQTRVSGDALDVPTDAYTLLDLSASWLFTTRGREVHSITLRVDNAFDEQYRDAASRIKSYAFNPGRNLSLVYRLLY